MNSENYTSNENTINDNNNSNDNGGTFDNESEVASSEYALLSCNVEPAKKRRKLNCQSQGGTTFGSKDSNFLDSLR